GRVYAGNRWKSDAGGGLLHQGLLCRGVTCRERCTASTGHGDCGTGVESYRLVERTDGRRRGSIDPGRDGHLTLLRVRARLLCRRYIGADASVLDKSERRRKAHPLVFGLRVNQFLCACEPEEHTGR